MRGQDRRPRPGGGGPEVDEATHRCLTTFLKAFSEWAARFAIP